MCSYLTLKLLLHMLYVSSCRIRLYSKSRNNSLTTAALVLCIVYSSRSNSRCNSATKRDLARSSRQTTIVKRHDFIQDGDGQVILGELVGLECRRDKTRTYVSYITCIHFRESLTMPFISWVLYDLYAAKGNAKQKHLLYMMYNFSTTIRIIATCTCLTDLL